MRKKLPLAIVFILLYFVFLLYRIAFWEDFLFKNLLQIILNSFFDVSIVFLFGYVIDEAMSANYPIKKYILTRILVYAGLVITFYLSVKLLKQLHYQAYRLTVGFTKEFIAIFELESYQIFDFYIVVAFGSAILLAFKFYEKWNTERMEKEHAEKEKVVTELQFLKAQINPHFVFNTLNNIHFLIDSSNHQARTVIHDFCKLLRYQLYETGNERVNIKNEIKYLEHYITLQKIRKEDGFSIQFTHQEDIDIHIAPLLLIVFVKNAFKYSGSSPNDYIHITLQMLTGNLFMFKVVNSISKKIELRDPTESGLGLVNLKKRLELVYGSRASLNIKNIIDFMAGTTKNNYNYTR